MGFFKGVHDMRKDSKERMKNMDVGAMMQQGQDQMKAATEQFAAQTQAANLAVTGNDATGSIISAAQTGQMLNYQPSMAIELTVFPEGGVPYPATVTQVVEGPYLAKAAPGQQVKLKVDTTDPSVIWIDWASSLQL